MSGSGVLTPLGFMGSQFFGQPGMYGTLDTPTVGNVPGGRTSPATWTDNSGNLWLFGGYGPTSTGYIGYFNDLWKFNPSTQGWAWMGGSSTIPTTGGEPGAYGTLGTSAAGNMPGARYQAVSWTDKRGNLWLFGGTGFDSAGNAGPLNDLWEFDPSTDQWTWVAGSSTVGSSSSCATTTCGRSGVYGTLGVFAAANTPGGRYGAASWTDGSGKLWLFGGTGLGSGGGPAFFLNDLWEFDPSIGQWAWIRGSSTSGSTGAGIPGTYGTMGQPAFSNRPGSRTNATTSVDSSGNFWLFGGWGYASISEPDVVQNPGYLDDLWEFNPKTQEWVWVGGSSTVPTYNQGNPGVYGTLGTPAAANLPGGRESANSWIDNNGNFWLFGGSGWGSANFLENLNDLWEFQPSAIIWPAATFTVSGAPVTVTAGATIANTATITVTPNGGFTGSVTLTATVTSGPAGAQYPPSLSFGSTNPLNITDANVGTATLTVATTALSNSAMRDPIQSGSPWYIGGATFACLLFLGMPARRHGWRAMLGTLVLIVAFTNGLVACGGGSSAGIRTGNHGSTPGVYTVTVTGTSGATIATGTVTVTVQ
jgi:N-acetylneuraminic acid mutarotase